MIRPFVFQDFLTLLFSLQWTVALTLIGFVGGAIGGLLLVLMQMGRAKLPTAIAKGFVTAIRGTPLLMQLFVVFFGGSVIGFDINPWIAAGFALSIHASAYLSDIWRGAIDALPVGQTEAGRALGLPETAVRRYIILPQALRVAIPPTTGFLVQLIKATSVTSIVGFVELTRTAQIINNATFDPLKVFLIVAALYMALCWPLSLFSRHLERGIASADRN